MSTLDKKAEEITKLREELGEIEMSVVTNYTLADAIREGAQVTEQAIGWGNGEFQACAMHSAVQAARSRNYM